MGHGMWHAWRRGASKVLVGKPEEKSHLEDLDIDGSIILKWISKNTAVRA
jgi:hypothetical protein